MKAAVFFPGVGYHVDKPLLYYTKKIAYRAGYEITDVPYRLTVEGVKGSPEKMKEAFEEALRQAEDMLFSMKWEQYEDIVFVSKSVGTAVAAAYANRHGLRVRNIFFTPVEQSFVFMSQSGIVFTGTADPWVKEGSIPKYCKEKGYPVFITDGGNHSLETEDVIKNLDNMREIMIQVQKYIGGSEKPVEQ